MQETETKLKRYLREEDIRITQLERKIRKEFPDDPMSYDTLHRIVSGERAESCHLKSILRICKVLGCTPNDIIEYDSADA